MKKQIITIAIMFGLGLTASAAPNEGLFNRAGNAENGNSGYAYFNGGDRNGGVNTPALPQHNQTGNQNAPLGSGSRYSLRLAQPTSSANAAMRTKQ